MTKPEYRKFIRLKQKEFFADPNYRIIESYGISQKISVTEEFKRSSFIFAFMPLEDEVNIGGLIVEAFLQNKRVAVPIIKDPDGQMEFHWISFSTPMKKSTYDIYEPSPECYETTRVNMEEMNFVNTNALLLVPGMAFSIDGKRLGRGKGFYDRFMSAYGKRFTKMGVGFKFQLAENIQGIPVIPTDENDIKVDNIIF